MIERIIWFIVGLVILAIIGYLIWWAVTLLLAPLGVPVFIHNLVMVLMILAAVLVVVLLAKKQNLWPL